MPTPALARTEAYIATVPTTVTDHFFPVNEPELKLDPHWPRILVQSSLQVGNKGEKEVSVAVPAECGKPTWVFNHAEIDIVLNRFGAAQFVGYPQPGCSSYCAPIVVRWYHEPSGHLAFGVKVYRRKAILPCPEIETDNQVDS